MNLTPNTYPPASRGEVERADNLKSSQSQRGSILVLVIVFCAVFMAIGVSLIQIMSLLHKASLKKQKLEQTFQIAEAGINFYKWRLAHEPENYGGGGTDYDYYNIDGEKIGHYHLEIGEPPLGSTVVTVTSTGHIDSDPGITRVLEARLAIPALSDYAFLTNSNAWIGESEEIVGKMHSNGGIRFDGESDSTVDSPLATYICGTEHGCDNEEHVGVWGTGVIQELWRFPPTHSINSVDFNQIILDLVDMKTEAQSGGEYLDDSGEFGWHLSFDYDSSTFEASKVTEVHQTYGWDFTDGWQWRNIDIKSESAPELRNLPTNGVIFVEDQVWVDGEIDQRLTLASANFTNPNIETSIIIHDDIIYENKDGSAAMGLIAQKDILIPLYSPEKLEIDAALLAQGGHCFRYYYPEDWYGADAKKDLIEIWGSVITNTIWTWSWVTDCPNPPCPVISGYIDTETTYDPYLTYGPPPEFPTSGGYEMVTWREVK